MQTKLLTIYPMTTLLLCCFSATAFAQSTPGALPTAGSGTQTTSGQVTPLAQDAADDMASTQSRTWDIKPRITLTETLTDNANINRTSSGKQSDAITRVAPGIRIEARTKRLKGYFDYSLRGQFYANQPDYNRNQNSLNTFATLEAIDNWLFLDFSGVIAQQTISAFGPQSTSNTAINNNSTETSTYRFSPYIRGQLGGTVDYLLRYTQSATQSSNKVASNVDITQWTGQINGSTPFKSLRWGINANQQTTDYSRGRKTDAELVRGVFNYVITPQFRLNVSAGQESNNYASLEQKSNTTHGYGFDWNPTQRTKLSVFKEKRFFGNAHNINLTHRFPMSSISFTDTKNVSVLPNQFANASLSSLYPQFAQICSQIIGSGQDQSFIDSCILSILGDETNTQSNNSALNSRATIQHRQQLSLTLFGARNTLTLMANRSENQSTLAGAANDDLSTYSTINQQGMSVNLSHRLSELSNLNLLGSLQESKGSGTTSIKTTTTLYQVNVSTKLGTKTTGSLSARRSEFDSSTRPYTENALVGTVSFIY